MTYTNPTQARTLTWKGQTKKTNQHLNFLKKGNYIAKKASINVRSVFLVLQILFPVNSRQGYRNSSPVLARRNFSQWSALVCYIDRLVDIFLLSRYGIVTGKLIFCPEPFHNSFNLVILSKQHGLCASVHIHWFFFTSKKPFNLPSRELRNKKFLYLVQMINTFNCRCNEKFVPRQCFFHCWSTYAFSS